MGSGIRRVYYDLPSIRNFFRSVADDLMDRLSVLVLLPRNVNEEEVVSEIQRVLNGFDLKTSTLEARTSDAQKPVEFFHSQYPAKWESVRILRNASSYLESIDRKELPEIIILDSIGDLSEQQRGEWMYLLREWAEASHHIKNRGEMPPALCIVAKAEDVLGCVPENALYLRVHWWWNIPSILELKMLCRLVNLQDREPNNISEWRENIIPSLALDDLGLIEFLWDRIDVESERIIDELCLLSDVSIHAAEFDESFQDLILERDKRFQTTPIPGVQSYWAKGYLCSTPEHGMEVSTLGLARINNRDELRHRIWRAQVDLLLPQIDNVRLVVCKYLTKTKGVEWPVKWCLPASEKEIQEVQRNPLATDLGYLDFLISQDSHFRDCHQFRRLVNLSHDIRNQIAHYQGVNYVDYKEFVEARLDALP
jgi:hypothetical protein